MSEPDFKSNWNDFVGLLYSEIEEKREFPQYTPLLAHYTSIVNLESILKSNEVWLSNPLFMNDLEEVRFGVQVGYEEVHRSEDLRRGLGSTQRQSLFLDSFDSFHADFVEGQVFDLYVMCFAEHDEGNDDGVLSMWRGYGGNGSGAALVFDTGRVRTPVESTSFVLSQVVYGSTLERRNLIGKKVSEVSQFFTDHNVSDRELKELARLLFERIALFSVFTKHIGFQEEKEWRLAYFPSRDEEGNMSQYFSYFNGPRGLEPKLKLPVGPLTGSSPDGSDLDNLVYSILLGPTASSPLAILSAKRMLEKIGHSDLTERVFASSVPYRG